MYTLSVTFFSLTWLPLLPTTAKPARVRALMTLRPDTTGRPNAADLHEGHERREAGVGQPCVLVLQVEAYRLAEGRERVLHRRALAGDVQLRAEGHVQVTLPRHDGGEPHSDTDQTSTPTR